MESHLFRRLLLTQAKSPLLSQHTSRSFLTSVLRRDSVTHTAGLGSRFGPKGKNTPKAKVNKSTQAKASSVVTTPESKV